MSLGASVFRFFFFLVIMSKPLDLIIAVMEEKKMLLIVNMAIMVMEVYIVNAIVVIATGKTALKGNMTFIQCTVLGCISCTFSFK